MIRSDGPGRHHYRQLCSGHGIEGFIRMPPQYLIVMSWDDFEEPTVKEIKEHRNSERLIKANVKKYECPECGEVNLVTYSNGWNNDYTCDRLDCDHSFRYVG